MKVEGSRRDIWKFKPQTKIVHAFINEFKRLKREKKNRHLANSTRVFQIRTPVVGSRKQLYTESLKQAKFFEIPETQWSFCEN